MPNALVECGARPGSTDVRVSSAPVYQASRFGHRCQCVGRDLHFSRTHGNIRVCRSCFAERRRSFHDRRRQGLLCTSMVPVQPPDCLTVWFAGCVPGWLCGRLFSTSAAALYLWRPGIRGTTVFIIQFFGSIGSVSWPMKVVSIPFDEHAPNILSVCSCLQCNQTSF
jgi:hypothetical protein